MTRLASIDSRLSVLKWMLGVLLALGLGQLWLTMTILSRLPR